MAEHIDNKDLLASGGHVWRWAPQPAVEKLLRSVGAAGAARMVLLNGERAFTIEGLDGGLPLLRASGANRAAADAAMDALEAEIELLRLAGTACTWEDDCGRTGSYLVITEFTAMERMYGDDGESAHCWCHYRLAGVELAGRPAA